MTLFLFTSLVLFGSFLANLALLDLLVDLIALKLWQTVPQTPLRRAAAEIDHFIAAIITAAVFGLLWKDNPVQAIFAGLGFYLILLTGGVLRLLLLTHKQIHLVEEQQFTLEKGSLFVEGNLVQGPLLFCLVDQKHPAADGKPTPYSSTALELYAPDKGRIARNIYYDRLKAARMAEALQEAGQVRSLDLALVGRSATGAFLSLRLSSCWIPLCCGPLRQLPPQIRDWWKSLLNKSYNQPERIRDSGFAHYLHPLYLAAEEEGVCQPGFLAEFTALEQLVKSTTQPLQIIAGQLLRSLIPSDATPSRLDPDTALLQWSPATEEC